MDSIQTTTTLTNQEINIMNVKKEQDQKEIEEKLFRLPDSIDETIPSNIQFANICFVIKRFLSNQTCLTQRIYGKAHKMSKDFEKLNELFNNLRCCVLDNYVCYMFPENVIFKDVGQTEFYFNRNQAFDEEFNCTTYGKLLDSLKYDKREYKKHPVSKQFEVADQKAIWVFLNLLENVIEILKTIQFTGISEKQFESKNKIADLDKNMKKHVNKISDKLNLFKRYFSEQNATSLSIEQNKIDALNKIKKTCLCLCRKLNKDIYAEIAIDESPIEEWIILQYDLEEEWKQMQS
jgi:hypothetical protein